MNIRILFSLFCLSFAVALGCTRPRPDLKMFVGKYCFSRDVKDSIIISTDSTYRHKFSASNGRVFEAAGKWEYDSIGQEIRFEDFIFFNDNGSDGLPPGNWFSRVQMDDNEVRLMYSSEDNIYFLKKIKKR